MSDPACRPFHDALEEATANSPSPDSPSPELAAHVAQCRDCAKVLARQRALVRTLSLWPAAPSVDLRPPVLPSTPGGRLIPMRAPAWGVASAAAVLVAAAWIVAARGVERVRIERVVDVAGGPPLVDERLLALTGGVEAVAMRRPTELR
jgi:hypothetical protein